MSRYGDADYDDMAYTLDEFLKNHRPSELLELVQDAVEWWETEYIQDTLPSAQQEYHFKPGDEDLISRRSLLRNIIKKLGIASQDYFTVQESVVVNCIYEEKPVPSVQPERKKGKWIHKPGIYGVAYCSECDFELHINDTPYCPHCGAEMKGEEDETD